MHFPFTLLLVHYWMVDIPTLKSRHLYPYGEIRGNPIEKNYNSPYPIGRDFNVPNPEGLESVSNWTKLGINSQQASATM